MSVLPVRMIVRPNSAMSPSSFTRSPPWHTAAARQKGPETNGLQPLARQGFGNLAVARSEAKNKDQRIFRKRHSDIHMIIFIYLAGYVNYMCVTTYIDIICDYMQLYLYTYIYIYIPHVYLLKVGVDSSLYITADWD